MSRPQGVPKYCRHKASGQAVVRLDGKDHYLGPYGSTESRHRYEELISDWLGKNDITECGTVSEVLLAFWSHAKQRYGRSGRGKFGAAISWRPAIRIAREMYGDVPVRDFGPKALKKVIAEMVRRGWSRGYILDQLGRLKTAFRWAASDELIPVQVYQRLTTVSAPPKGATGAKENPPVQPVADDLVDATLPYLPPVVADMVRFQRVTGCRPAEACIVRPCDVDRSGDVWVYRPQNHKTERYGKHRRIYVGPKGQDVLRKYLVRRSEDYCFSPAESERRRREVAHGQRKTPLKHGNHPGSNCASEPKRTAGRCYITDSYRRAIHRTCERRHAQLTKEWAKATGRKTDEYTERVEKWSPNQLRHTAATQVRAEFGAEHAQAILGHSNLSTTEIYAEVTASRAIEAARCLG
jgi:integrase